MPNGKLDVRFDVQPHAAYEPMHAFSDDPVIHAIQRAAHDGANSHTATLHVNGKLAWELDIDGAAHARRKLRKDMQTQARARGIDLIGLSDALAREFHWSEDEATALALAFIFPALLIFDRLSVTAARAPTAGRPPSVDQRTLLVWKLADAWRRVTGRCASVAERGHFVRAIEAAAPFIPIQRRNGDGSVTQLRSFLRTELRKLRSDAVFWPSPLSLRPS